MVGEVPIYFAKYRGYRAAQLFEQPWCQDRSGAIARIHYQMWLPGQGHVVKDLVDIFVFNILLAVAAFPIFKGPLLHKLV